MKRRMTEREKFELHEERIKIYERDKGICQHCFKPVGINEFEVAHRIANTITNRRRWGDYVIDHPLNKATTHRGACNSGMNIGFKPDQCRRLAKMILAS